MDDGTTSRRGSFAAWNEEMVRRYDIDQYYDSSWLVKGIETLRLRAVAHLARVTPGARLLEVGCGTGRVLERFPQARRTGIDLSSTMLAGARQRLGSAVGLGRAFADALPFDDGSFGIVVCTEVLEHTMDPAAALRELLRVAGDGRVVVSIPNERRIAAAKHVLGRVPWLRRILKTVAPEDNEWHLHAMDLRSLYGLAAGCAEIQSTLAIPCRLLPLRYVVLLRAAKGKPQRGN